MANGEVRPESMPEIGRHLDECPLCAQRAAGAVDPNTLSARINDALAMGDEHPDLDTLTAFVDRTLDAAGVEWLREHLQSCARCREDVSDLNAERTALERRTFRWQWLAASILLVGAIAGSALWLRNRMNPSPLPTPAAIRPSLPDRWIELERSTLAAGTLPRPAIFDELRPASQVVRGKPTASRAVLQPAGEVVADDRPLLAWTAEPGAEYVVTIMSSDEPVATSGRLADAQWTPPQRLPRGKTYLWQVEVARSDGTSIVLPAPPAPEALIHVADAATVAEIEAAARAHPGDPLLLGILYARAGIKSRAVSKLAEHVAAHPADARAAALAAAVRNW